MGPGPRLGGSQLGHAASGLGDATNTKTIKVWVMSITILSASTCTAPLNMGGGGLHKY